jgi:predicted RNA binding protein YcfA (HicA-like mRNA interferase family)
MPNRSFSDITQAQWLSACIKLGLIVDKKSGKGSHALIKHPNIGHKYTIQKNLHKFINIKIFKKMLEWGFEEEDIWKALN